MSDWSFKKSKRGLRSPYKSQSKKPFEKSDIAETDELYGTDNEVSIHKPQERRRGVKLVKPKKEKMKEKQQLNGKCQQYVSDHPSKKSKWELHSPYEPQSKNPFQKPDISEVNELYKTEIFKMSYICVLMFSRYGP